MPRYVVKLFDFCRCVSKGGILVRTYVELMVTFLTGLERILLKDSTYYYYFLLKDSVQGFFGMILLKDSFEGFFYRVLLKDSFERFF